MNGNKKGKPEKYQDWKCKTEKLPFTFKVDQNKNRLTYQMKGKKRKGLPLTRRRIDVFNWVDDDGQDNLLLE
jgi:hypothetical protein